MGWELKGRGVEGGGGMSPVHGGLARASTRPSERLK